MNLLARDQLAKINRILGDNDPVFGEASCQYDVIGIAQPAHITWMDRVMLPAGTELMCQLGREALVDEQPQAAWAQGRPPGLPTSGCVRA